MTYFVFRRDHVIPHLDGYFGVESRSSREAWEAGLRPTPGERFVLLLETEDWPTARAKVERMRNGEPS